MNGRSGSGYTGRSGEGGSSQGTNSPAGFTEHSTENKSLLENRMEPLRLSATLHKPDTALLMSFQSQLA